jgi:hypothetical protein
MQRITSKDTLRKAIITLEQKQIEDGKRLKEQFSIAYESLKPVNVLRNAIYELTTTSSELKENLLQSAIGLMTGYLSRKIVVRSSKNHLLRLAGIVVQYGVTNLVSNNSEVIRKVLLRFIQKLLGLYHLEKN